MKPDIAGLTKLAQVLRRVPKKNFDMRNWLMKEPSCGTVGCIAGWAAITFPHRFKQEVQWDDGNGNVDYNIIHRRSDTVGYEAFANGFKISYEDARDLTLQRSHTKVTPQAAAKQVMLLVGRLKKASKK